MPSQLTPGAIGRASLRVEDSHTAAAVGSGSVDVLATPVMIRLVEQAAVASLKGLLPSGQTTVGAHLDVRHMAATPVGMEATALAELVEVDGRKLVFRVEVQDEVELVGQGTHMRVMVDEARFAQRAASKR
jgi:fluoroacetyl-CoA thioesterase